MKTIRNLLAIVAIVTAIGAVGIISAVGATPVAHAGKHGSCNQTINGDDHLLGLKTHPSDRKSACNPLKH